MNTILKLALDATVPLLTVWLTDLPVTSLPPVVVSVVLAVVSVVSVVSVSVVVTASVVLDVTASVVPDPVPDSVVASVVELVGATDVVGTASVVPDVVDVLVPVPASVPGITVSSPHALLASAPATTTGPHHVRVRAARRIPDPPP